MKGKSNFKKLISKFLVLAMVLISMTNAVPKQVNAAIDPMVLASTYLNATTKYLHLGNQETGTYNFNINESAKQEGETYFWYVKADKGNPDSVTIDVGTGVVTAMEVGTAYIRCKVTLADGSIRRPEAKVIVRNNITEVDISNLPTNMTITVGKEMDFNRSVLNTEGGKGKTTLGLTRWEIDKDTAGVGSATDKGVVSPSKVGEFSIRAISFQSKEKYNLWLKDKILNEEYITAASKWYPITVAAEVPITPTPVPSSGGGGTYIPPVITVRTITITSEGNTNTAVSGGAIQLEADITPTNASDQSIVWSVATLLGGSATISSTTGLLTATRIGTVRVTATNVASGVIGTLDITITAPLNNYTALGDSITYGMSATPNFGYVDLFYNNLKSIDGNEDLSLLNLGRPGAKSSDLLNLLQNDAITRDAVSKSKVITVSIGGNNLLSPVINAFATAFQLNPTSATFANDLALAMADPSNQQKFNSVITGLQTNLGSGVQQFTTDWVNIIGTIKLLSPQANVYVMTLYNPFDKLDPLYPIFDTLIQTINSIICTPDTGYKVANVYNEFKDFQGTEPLVNFSISTGSLDPHPTTKGHEVIYQSHVDIQPLITNVSIVSSNPNNTKAMNGDIITLTFKADEPVTKLSNFKINGSNPDTFTNVGNVYTATHLVDAGDVVTGVPVTFQINVKNAFGIYSLTVEATTDGSSVTIIDKMPRITDVRIVSNNADITKAIVGDTITLTFKADEAVTKLSNFKINGSNPDTFTNVGDVYTATHLVDEGDVVTGTPATFQINVKNAAGIYSLTVEATTDGSSVTIIGETATFKGTVYASDFDRDLNNNTVITGAKIAITKIPVENVDGVETFSDAQGDFSFNNLTIGSYLITVTMNGYVSYINDNYFVDGTDNTLIIYLDRGEQTSVLTGMITVADEDTIANNNVALPDISITLTKIGSSTTISRTVVSNSLGNYTFGSLSCGLYEITVENDGFIAITSEISITSSNTTTYNITLEAIASSYAGNGFAKGRIINSLSGAGVESGLTLTVYKGYNISNGAMVGTTSTDNSGDYTLELAAGNYTVYITDNRVEPTTKYHNGYFNIKVLGNITISNQNGEVTPILSSGEIRIVLIWGETPEDLDSHLTGPTNDGTRFHIYYSDQDYSQGEVLMDNLDVDDTSSYGPETTTIYHQEDGIYKFSIHDYSNRSSSDSMEMANSGAYVRVYMESSTNSIRTYYVPNLAGTVWDVFEYNSVTGEFTDLNLMSYNSSPGSVAALNGNARMRVSVSEEVLKDYELIK